MYAVAIIVLCEDNQYCSILHINSISCVDYDIFSDTGKTELKQAQCALNCANSVHISSYKNRAV